MAQFLTLGVLLAAVSCAGDSPGDADPPAQYITARRAWAPGERDSVIAAVQTGQDWTFPGVGNVSLYADLMLDPESVTVMVPNPDYGTASRGVLGVGAVNAHAQAANWNTGWNIYGIDVWIINNDPVPPDTTRWVGVFWWNPAESNWKGWVIAAADSHLVSVTAVNNTVFDASGGQAGAAAGEKKASDGTEWLATGVGLAPNNRINVSAAAYGVPTTITTGPFLGGTIAGGGMQGRLRNVPIARVVGSGPQGPATQTVDLNFTGGMNAVQIICRFRNPCTTNVP